MIGRYFSTVARLYHFHEDLHFEISTVHRKCHRLGLFVWIDVIFYLNFRIVPILKFLLVRGVSESCID